MNNSMQPEAPAPKLLTITKFCTEYECSRSTAYRLAAASEIEMVKLGRATRITVTSAQAWAASLPAMGK